MPTSDTFPSCWFALILLFVVATWSHHAVAMRKRRRSLQQLAEKFSLQRWPDDSLPHDLYLSGSSLSPVRRIFNVYTGKLGGVEIALFDIAKPAGRSVTYFSVIAARGSADFFGAEAFDLDLTTERTDRWLLLYLPRSLFQSRSRLFRIEELEANLESIRRIRFERERA